VPLALWHRRVKKKYSLDIIPPAKRFLLVSITKDLVKWDFVVQQIGIFLGRGFGLGRFCSEGFRPGLCPGDHMRASKAGDGIIAFWLMSTCSYSRSICVYVKRRYSAFHLAASAVNCLPDITSFRLYCTHRDKGGTIGEVRRRRHCPQSL